MPSKKNLAAALALTLPVAFGFTGAALQAQAQEDRQAAAGAGLARKLGTVKSVNANTITLQADAGPDFSAVVQDSTRILRIPPGQTDLKNAVPIKLQEVQVGDRMLVRGKAGDVPDSIAALQIMVMTKSDVAQKQQQDLQDWQKRGVGGIVSAIDPAAGSVTVAVTPAASYAVKTSKTTSFLRYAPNSVKFADAQKGTFDQIKVGDQLRARGNRSADGKEVAAEEVISGTFRNIAGTVSAIDAANNTLTVKDILAKKTVVVRLSPESQMRKLPQPLAQRIAFFLKAPAGAQGPSAQSAGSAAGSKAPEAGVQGSNGGPGGGAGLGSGRGGSPDFQQVINRLPALALADLQKDEAVMIVSTAGTGNSEVTAITLLSGVEPIFTASPNAAGAAALLSGWNLSAPGGGDSAP
jgi:Domain of unknown function (DUF5666)